jgi:hypothetical protein
MHIDKNPMHHIREYAFFVSIHKKFRRTSYAIGHKATHTKFERSCVIEDNPVVPQVWLNKFLLDCCFCR